MKNTLLLVMAVLALMACSSDKEDTNNASSTFINVESQITLGAEETEKIFEIKSNTSWIISVENGWQGLHISPMEGKGDVTVKITTSQNRTVNEKEATLTVKGDNLSKIVKLKQMSGAVEFAISDTEYTFEASGGTWEFTITSNDSWTIGGDNVTGFTVTPTSGAGNASVKVIAEPNTETSERRMILTVMAGGKQGRINITQKGKATLSVTPNSIAADEAAGFHQIDIISNSNWTATTDQSWLSLSSSSGEGNATINVLWEDTSKSTVRSANVMVRAGELSMTVTVNQSAGTYPQIKSINHYGLSKGGVTITSEYTSATSVTECGICYSTENTLPTTDDSKIKYDVSEKIGTINAALNDLSPSTLYYARVYVRNTVGTAYSEVITFTTKDGVPEETDIVTPNI